MNGAGLDLNPVARCPVTQLRHASASLQGLCRATRASRVVGLTHYSAHWRTPRHASYQISPLRSIFPRSGVHSGAPLHLAISTNIAILKFRCANKCDGFEFRFGNHGGARPNAGRKPSSASAARPPREAPSSFHGAARRMSHCECGVVSPRCAIAGSSASSVEHEHGEASAENSASATIRLSAITST